MELNIADSAAGSINAFGKIAALHGGLIFL